MFFNESHNYNKIDVQPTNLGITGDAAGAYRIIAESAEEWYTLREKMMRLEHTAIVTEDAMLLEAGVNDFIGKIVAFFKKVWAKIKELWQKFMVFFNQYTMNAKKFITKYEKVIRNKSYSGFKFKGYTFKGLNDGEAATAGIKKVVNEAMGISNGIVTAIERASKKGESEEKEFKVDDNYEDSQKKVICPSADPENFGKEYADFLRGSDEAEEIEGVKVDNIISNLKNGQKEIDALVKVRDGVDKMYSTIISDLNKISDKFYNATDKTPGNVSFSHRKISRNDEYEHKFDKTDSKDEEISISSQSQRNTIKNRVNQRIEEIRKSSVIVNEAYGIVIQVKKEELNQNKSVAAKMISYKPNKSESYNFSDSVLDRF